MRALERVIGIEIPQTKLTEVSEILGLPIDSATMKSKALALQRFDRGQRVGSIHMEEFAKVFGLYLRDKYHHRSYANIAAVIRAEAREENTYEFFRRFGTVRRNFPLGCESNVKTGNRYR